MNELHSLLKRQLRRFTGETESLSHEQANLFQAINDAYLQFDVERRMLEHSLELTSQELLEANAELSRRNTDLEMRVEARTAELSSSEARFRELFEHAPVSIWEEDFSAVREYIDDLRRAEVVDFSAYFDAHPEAVGESAARVKIVDVNRATLEMYQAESKEQLLADLSKVLGPESLIPFKQELLALTRGETSFENETINYTLRGERRVVFVRLTVAPGSEQTWVKVFVGISDITERRLAEAALAIERDLLQALMDNIPDTIYFKDTDSRFTRINRAQVNVLGIAAPEEAIGKTDFDFFQNAELVQSFYYEEQRIIETGQPLINRIEFNPTPDGQPRWFSATKVPIKDEAGYVIGIVGISRDITERKQAEEALQQSEETTRLIIDTALDAVITIDQDGQITRWNDQAEAIFGWSRVEAVGQRLSELIIPPDLRAKHERGLKHYSETGEGPVLGKRIEITAQRRNGNIFPVELAIHVLKANNKVSFAAFVRDITERKQAEEALRQSEERFKLMAWATIDAVWDWDLQTNQISWGEGLQKIFHYSSETAQTNPEWRRDHIHPEDRAKVNRAIEQAVEGGLEFWSKEYRFQRKDETYADIMDRGYIIRDDMGKPSRMIGAMMDITERKQTEAALQEANEKMARSLNELALRNQEIALLNEMSDLLQASRSERAAHIIIGDAARQLFPGTIGALYLFNTERTLVNGVASWGDPPPAAQTFAPDDCWALQRGQTRQLYEEDAKPPCRHVLEALPVVSYCLPMVAQNEILGVLHLQSPSKDNLTEPKRQLAYTVVEQAGMALSNLKLREALREQSIRDPLTGLYNRRYMEEVLKQQLSRVTRHLHPLGIIMIDIDHFKLFNDTHGHAAGDALLRELSRFLQSHIRGEDVACRYGGEEFILIMPDASLETARQRAEYLRQEAKGVHVHDAGQSLEGITMSLGVASYPQNGRNREAVMGAADAALYRAKQEGRDRVVVAERAY
jgi:diguanylate cyclase (GGDEF)-like protein/PAS domain S-box-containing protein